MEFKILVISVVVLTGIFTMAKSPALSLLPVQNSLQFIIESTFPCRFFQIKHSKQQTERLSFRDDRM
jgi:hypothetical protein